MSEPRFDPYAAPGAVGSVAPPGRGLSLSRGGALLVLCGEAGRSLLWRLNAGIGLVYRSWPDTTVPNRVIKLLGALLVLWGAWRLTREGVSAFARVATRVLAAIAVGGHVARLVFALTDVSAFASEPAMIFVDALAVSACALCVVPAFRAGPTRGAAAGAILLAAAYFVASTSSALLLLATGRGVHFNLGSDTVLRSAISLSLLAIGAWAAVLVSRLPRGPTV
jgi:hypothetical protein